jgi:hypothetical protein
VRQNLDHFAAASFEKTAGEYITARARAGKWFFLPERIESWWSGEAKLNVLTIHQAEKTALVGECKWSVNPVRTNILEDLKRRTGAMAQESGIENIQYVLFSHKGFTDALKEQAANEQTGLFTVEDLVQSGK